MYPAVLAIMLLQASKSSGSPLGGLLVLLLIVGAVFFVVPTCILGMYLGWPS